MIFISRMIHDLLIQCEFVDTRDIDIDVDNKNYFEIRVKKCEEFGYRINFEIIFEEMIIFFKNIYDSILAFFYYWT